MTTATQSESKSSSRRALLAGALGGIAAWAATVMGRPAPAAATDGQAILQGVDNSGSTSTVVRVNTATASLQGVTDATSGAAYGVRGRNSSTSGAGVLGVGGATSGATSGVLGLNNSPNDNASGVRGESADGGGIGVYGISPIGNGVWGTSPSGIGVHGTSTIGQAVFGFSSGGHGVHGSTGNAGAIGVLGSSDSGRAVLGQSSATDLPAVVGLSTGDNTGVVAASGTLPNSKAKTGLYGYAAQDGKSRGVWGFSPAGHGLHGQSNAGWAGYFAGRIYTSKYHEMQKISAPAAPSANRARLFVRDNGSGKSQLCVRFNTGGVVVIKTQP